MDNCETVYGQALFVIHGLPFKQSLYETFILGWSYLNHSSLGHLSQWKGGKVHLVEASSNVPQKS